MTAPVVRVVKRTFSDPPGCVVARALAKPDKAESKQAAEFSAALCWRHQGGGERVRAFH